MDDREALADLFGALERFRELNTGARVTRTLAPTKPGDFARFAQGSSLGVELKKSTPGLLGPVTIGAGVQEFGQHGPPGVEDLLDSGGDGSKIVVPGKDRNALGQLDDVRKIDERAEIGVRIAIGYNPNRAGPLQSAGERECTLTDHTSR